MGELLSNLFWVDLGGVRVWTLGLVGYPMVFCAGGAFRRIAWKRRLKRMWQHPPGRREGMRPLGYEQQQARAEAAAEHARARTARREQRLRSAQMVKAGSAGGGGQGRRGKGKGSGQYLPKPSADIPADAPPLTPRRPSG